MQPLFSYQQISSLLHVDFELSDRLLYENSLQVLIVSRKSSYTRISIILTGTLHPIMIYC